MAEEKDETSNNRSHTLCPPHTVHYELPDDLQEHQVIVGIGELEPAYTRIVVPAKEAVEEILNEENEVIVPAQEAVEAITEDVPAVMGLRLIFDQAKADAELVKARVAKLASIRVVRDQLLTENDREWLIAAKQKQSTVNIEVIAQALRDLPEVAAAALEELETLESINAYDAFGA